MEVVKNYHEQLQGITSLRLGRALLCGSLFHHVEDKVNVADIPLQCRSVSLKKFLRPTALLFPISVIMWQHPCNIWGRTGRRVPSAPSEYIRKWGRLEDSIWTGNSGSMRR